MATLEADRKQNRQRSFISHASLGPGPADVDKFKELILKVTSSFDIDRITPDMSPAFAALQQPQNNYESDGKRGNGNQVSGSVKTIGTDSEATTAAHSAETVNGSSSATSSQSVNQPFALMGGMDSSGGVGRKASDTSSFFASVLSPFQRRSSLMGGGTGTHPFHSGEQHANGETLQPQQQQSNPGFFRRLSVSLPIFLGGSGISRQTLPAPIEEKEELSSRLNSSDDICLSDDLVSEVPSLSVGEIEEFRAAVNTRRRSSLISPELLAQDESTNPQGDVEQPNNTVSSRLTAGLTVTINEPTVVKHESEGRSENTAKANPENQDNNFLPFKEHLYIAGEIAVLSPTTKMSTLKSSQVIRSRRASESKSIRRASISSDIVIPTTPSSLHMAVATGADIVHSAVNSNSNDLLGVLHEEEKSEGAQKYLQAFSILRDADRRPKTTSRTEDLKADKLDSFGKVVKIATDMKATGMDPKLAFDKPFKSELDKDTLTMVLKLKKWAREKQKKNQANHLETAIKRFNAQVETELPINIEMDMIADILPVVELYKKMYTKELGEKHSFAVGAQKHFEKLKKKLETSTEAE
ncbi:hypothetical protein HDU82_005604 [Entophlyctis luteolus]|nr:hypothetical protein HDU82_005604 [Entophlyctis luteolus]